MLLEIGRQIRVARKSRKITQAALGKALGMSRSTIGQIEKGTVQDIGVRKLLRLFYVGLGLINLGRSFLYVGAGYGMGAKFHGGGEIFPPFVAIPEDTDLHNLQFVAKAMRVALDFIWREYNYPGSMNYSRSGEWAVR